MNVRVPRALTFASLSASAAITLSTLAACAGSTGATNAAVSAPARAAVAPPAPKPFEYAASTGQYRYTAEAKQSRTMMGQSQDMNSSEMRLMTISLMRATADTLTMSLTIDSMSAVAPMGMPNVGIDKVPGSKFTAKLSPNGSFYSATGPSEADNPRAAAMIDEVGRMLPRIAAILKVGAVWTDTLKDNVKQTGLDVAREIVSKYTVNGDTTVTGEPSWKITREVSFSASGAGAIQGTAVSLATTGTASGIMVVSKRGVLLGGRATESSTSNVTVTMNGMQIGLGSVTTSMFTKIK